VIGQARYWRKIRSGENKRIQVVLPGEVAIKLDYLAAALQCNKTELLGRLILEEWDRQGQPIPKQGKRH
jgi:hypothetical protein